MTSMAVLAVIAALMVGCVIGMAIGVWDTGKSIHASYCEGRKDALDELAARMDAKREWRP